MPDHQPPRRITPFEPPHFGAARFPLSEQAIVGFVQAALDEDRAFEDITTLANAVGFQYAYDGQSNSVRLAPRRSGDLRECALELVNLVEVVAHVRSEKLL